MILCFITDMLVIKRILNKPTKLIGFYLGLEAYKTLNSVEKKNNLIFHNFSIKIVLRCAKYIKNFQVCRKNLLCKWAESK